MEDWFANQRAADTQRMLLRRPFLEESNTMKFDAELFNRPSDHDSTKGGGRIHCLNSYVRKACWLLDSDGNVKKYSHRTIEYRFYHPRVDKFATNAFDFDVEFDSGRQLIQCIPDAFLKDEAMMVRIEAMEAKAEEMGLPFVIWGEMILFGTKPAYRKSIIEMTC